MYDSLSKTFSQKTDLNITVHSIAMDDFPNIIALMNVDSKANLIVYGKVELTSLDIDYMFTSDDIIYDSVPIADDFYINGHVSGHYENMYVTGDGVALGGKIYYSTTKKTDSIENLIVSMKDIHSNQLFERMGQTVLVDGKADVQIDFTLMNEAHTQGTFIYDVKDKNFSGIPITLHSKVNIDDMHHTFIIDIKGPSLTLKVKDGTYDQEKKLAKASYTLAVKELSHLDKLLGFKYQGGFDAQGELLYKDSLRINGHSKTYGGTLDYTFEKNALIVNLNNISFNAIMSIFPYEPILRADTSGKIYYNFFKETLIVNTKLQNAKFITSKFSKNIYKKSHVRMTKETFMDSQFDAAYHNGVLASEVKLGNNDRHANLSNAVININKNTIQTYFDFKLQDKAFSGKVYGDYRDPEVDLNTKEALNYQLTHRFDSFIGSKNRENVEKFINTIPLGNSIKDAASDAAASFIDMLF
jgi:hypothetical protein